jgi:hypothetical protein
MIKSLLPVAAMLIVGIAQAQNTFKAILKDSTTKERLIGATAAIKGTPNGASSNTTEKSLLIIFPMESKRSFSATLGTNRWNAPLLFQLPINP